MKMDKRILSFLLMSFGIVWVITGVGILGLGITTASGTSYIIMAALCMLAPAIAAAVQQHVFDKEAWTGLGISVKNTRWGVLAFTVLVGVCIVPLSLLACHLLAQAFPLVGFGEVALTTDHMLATANELSMNYRGAPLDAEAVEKLSRISPVLVLVFVALGSVGGSFTVNLPFMLGEELGWRGYLWQRTQHWSGVKRASFTGIVWGLWHAPLIAVGHNYPGHPVQGILMMTAFCYAVGFLFDWTRSRSGTVWSSCILHGIINGSAGAFMLFAKGGHPLFGSVAGMGGIVAIGTLVALVVLLDGTYRKQLL
ncbi:MAG: CPBP family intramembrane metalloprotease [Flavobacteriales bacterium]|nr:CPBP family intramembrane metalloprotease [Flavobacteriales bacterium]